jgi:GNAT superfamily N-acetyltransferase
VSSFRIEPYDPSRRDDYLRLVSDAWGKEAMQGDQFDWWFDRNPAGSLMSVAVIDDEVVGVASHTLAQLEVAGERRLGQYSVHAVTTERARGLGIFRALEEHHEELGRQRGSSCVLAFASASTRHLFLGPLVWSQIDHPRVWARPLRGMVERRLGRGGTGPVPAGKSNGIERIEEFGPAQEAAYRALAPTLGNHLVRDAKYLQWRYFDSPKPYTAYASDDGFAVLGHAQRGRLSTGLVMELLAPPGHGQALLARCIREARRDDVLVAVPSLSLPRSLLARSGFVPVRTRLDYMGLGLTQPLDPRPTSWTISLGDTDFF